MGYAIVVQQETPSYVVSNNILGSVTGTAASQIVMHKVAQILRLTPINLVSDLRVQYQITVGAAHSAQVQIYLNGVAIGALSGAMNAAGSPYVYSEDFNLTSIKQGDSIEAWLIDNVAAGSDSVDYLRVCGDPITWR